MSMRKGGRTTIVLGSGPSGIVSVKELSAAGFSVKCFDSQSEIGGVWNWAWESLEMTTSNVMSAFSDFAPRLQSKIWVKNEYNNISKNIYISSILESETCFP